MYVSFKMIWTKLSPKNAVFLVTRPTLSQPPTHSKLKPEDHSSWNAHLTAEEMLKFSPRARPHNPCGQNFDVNGYLLSLWPTAASLNSISLNFFFFFFFFTFFFHYFILVYISGAGHITLLSSLWQTVASFILFSFKLWFSTFFSLFYTWI